ncbi:protein disulfide oxidoreductase [Microbulbifer sp. A4B17]|uniref:protein disulfide oxidoreductase n=1 Tax=Microbulbifer sp. A4B17 TaxID=359370 RepID=UPI001EDF836A|nr:protein disulfide oxidoreductase [Microbulbifer sp. A4B17]
MVTAVGYFHQRDIPKDLAPQLEGQSLDGIFIDLKQMYPQGPVLIYFWATWCPYCRIVSPAVAELSQEYQVIGIAMQSGSKEVVAEYMRNHDIAFPSLNDPQGILTAQWGVKVTPTLLIVGTDGKIAWVTTGATSKLGLQLRLKMTK